jgi:hypothetical protein
MTDNCNSKDPILGAVFTFIGLFLWIYSFYIAYNYVIGIFIIDATFGIRFIFLLIIFAIGRFLIKKSHDFLQNSKKRAYILIALGILFLILCFLLANFFLIAAYAMVPYILLVLLFYFYLVGLGMYCIIEGLREYKEIKKISSQEESVDSKSYKSGPIDITKATMTENIVPPAHSVSELLPSYQTLRCPSCNAEISGSDKYCVICGAPAGTTTPDQSS